MFNENTFNYSQEEQKIGTWINGKTLYMKTYVSNVSGNSMVNIKLADLNYDMAMVDLSMSYSRTTGNTYAPVTYYNSTSDNSVTYVSSSGDLRIQNNASDLRTYHVTIRYTKK